MRVPMHHFLRNTLSCRPVSSSLVGQANKRNGGLTGMDSTFHDIFYYSTTSKLNLCCSISFDEFESVVFCFY
jgi:hypothetical protein